MDKYGGFVENWMRFLIEMVEVVLEEIGFDCLGVWIFFFIDYNDFKDDDLVVFGVSIV